jgi:hypothetical protein|tara:strand:- start:1076 stop:1729 length:654 start_codon:yes stop_codon:yes gene_type:complete
MSPIRTKPFRTRSAGQQTTKVLDGKCRVFPSTIDAGRFAQVPAFGPGADLAVRFMTSAKWSSTTNVNDPEFGLGSSNAITGESSSQGQHNSDAYYIVAVNKMCRIHYDLTISSENNYDWGYFTLSSKSTSYTPNNVGPTTGAPKNIQFSRISGSTSRSGYIDMDSWRTLNSHSDNYDLGFDGDEGEMLVVVRYRKDGSANSGDDKFTINSLYFEDIP